MFREPQRKWQINRGIMRDIELVSSRGNEAGERRTTCVCVPFRAFDSYNIVDLHNMSSLTEKPGAARRNGKGAVNAPRGISIVGFFEKRGERRKRAGPEGFKRSLLHRGERTQKSENNAKTKGKVGPLAFEESGGVAINGRFTGRASA